MPPAKKKGKAPEPEAAPAVAPVEPTGDEPNERIIPGANDWEPAKIMIKPREQVSLTDKELQEEFTKILRADNPEAPKTIIRFSHKEKCFKLDPAVDQLELHFQQEGCMLNVNSDEAKKQKEREEDEKAAAAKEADKKKSEGGDQGDEDATNLRNQFNFSERASQTYNYAMRERGTMTEAPARANYGATATQWAMYDAYTADLERQAAAKEKSTKKKTVKEEKRSSTANPLSRDPNDEAASGWNAAAKIVDLRVARKIERMCNQNTFDDVAQDFKYWDDPSDSFKEGEASLLPLWKLTYEKARKRTVTCMAWCPSYWDLLFVGFGSYDYTKQGAGVIAAYSLKNPSFPEYTVETDNGVMCIAVHPEQPSLLAVGFYNGEVAVYEFR